MNKKIDHLIGLGILAILLVVNIAMAHASTGDATTGNTIYSGGNTVATGNTLGTFNPSSLVISNFPIDQAYLEKDPGYIGKQSKLNAVIANAAAIINIRVNDLNKLRKVVVASSLNDNGKGTLTAKIDEQVTALQALAVKIKADTDITVAKADAKSIYTNFRTYGVLIPKIKTMMAVMILEANRDKMVSAISETQARINQDETKCLNITARQDALNKASALLDWSWDELGRVSDKVNSLTPDNYSDGSRAYVLEANKVIRDAKVRLNSVRLYINRANGKSYTTCNRSQTCSTAGVCVAKPVCNNQCTNGQTGAISGGISNPGASYWSCTKDANGCFVKKEATCTTGNVFISGKCVALTSLNQCVLGVTGCTNTSTMWTCVNSNYGYTTKQASTCSSGQTCTAGKCAANAVTPGTLPISTDGKCVTGQIACPAGSVCVDTVCRKSGTTY